MGWRVLPCWRGRPEPKGFLARGAPRVPGLNWRFCVSSSRPPMAAAGNSGPPGATSGHFARAQFSRGFSKGKKGKGGFQSVHHGDPSFRRLPWGEGFFRSETKGNTHWGTVDSIFQWFIGGQPIWRPPGMWSPYQAQVDTLKRPLDRDFCVFWLCFCESVFVFDVYSR